MENKVEQYSVELNEELIQGQAKLAEQYMSSHDAKGDLSYHNWKHVSHVIDSARKLSIAAKIENEEAEDLILAAIWHDADFANGAEGHERRSSEVAANALLEAGLSSERIVRVKQLICGTKLDHKAEKRLVKLLRDADLSHMGSKNYFDFYQGLLKELNSHGGMSLKKEEWQSRCLNFFSEHRYHTQEARAYWNAGKEKNLNQLKTMKMSEGSMNMAEEEKLSKEERKALKKARKKDQPKFNAEKGIETMFRVSLRNHINLSRIADDKANTLISVNAIILSIVLSALFPKMDSNPWLIYPGMALILVSISTIILSTLSTIPKTTHGAVSLADVKNKKGNLLFFGNFHKMSLEEFEFGIGELMKDGSYLYGSLTRDLYFLGKVLDRKYGLLRRAYVVFVFGLVISILLFAWSIFTLAPELVSHETADIL